MKRQSCIRVAVATATCAALLAGACSENSTADDEPAASDRTVELTDRAAPVTVPTVRGLFVWGGNRTSAQGNTDVGREFAPLYLDDGAILTEPGSTGAPVASAPFDAPLRGAVGIAAGDRVVVAGTTCEEAADVDSDQPECRPDPELAAAVYDPTDDTWRDLEVPDELRTASGIWFLGTTDDGRVVARVVTDDQGLWTIDTESATWTLVDAPLDFSAECVLGSLLAQLTPQGGLRLIGLPADGADPDAPGEGERLAAERTGEPAPTPTVAPMICTDDAVYVHASGRQPAVWQDDGTLTTFPDPPDVLWRYDLATDAWSRSSDAPPVDNALLTIGIWTGDEVLLLEVVPDFPGLAYAPATDTWRLIDRAGGDVPDTPPPVWTPDGIPVWTRTGLGYVDVGG